eukprot:1151806-Pelagomonas_calceolata.AAC.3
MPSLLLLGPCSEVSSACPQMLPLPTSLKATPLTKLDTWEEVNCVHISADHTSHAVMTLTVVPSPLIAGTGLTLANLVENPSLVKQILYEHIILDNVITDTGYYMTWNDANVTVTLEDGYVTSFARASGDIAGAQDVPTVANVQGNTTQNANGHIAQITGGAPANGRIFFVDQAQSAQNMSLVVHNVQIPGGKWKTELENLGNQTFDDTLELIDLEGLESIKDLIDGTEDFTMFMPNDEALGELAGQYKLDGVEELKTRMRSNTGLAKQMLETYIVMGNVDENVNGTKEYPTK